MFENVLSGLGQILKHKNHSSLKMAALECTDGETNATLRRSDTAEGMALERGLELLAGRRAWEAENGPSPKKSRKKASSYFIPGDTTLIPSSLAFLIIALS